MLNGQSKQNHTTRKIARAILACAVAFVTMFALSIPAFSEEAETFCGHEEHKHTKDCYTKELTCGQEESEGHTHSEECYETVETQVEVGTEQVLICELEETPAQEEVLDEEGNVVTEAVEGHTHSEECYETRPIYETVTEEVLVCGQEESEGHTHTKDCYTKKLTCDKEEHEHDAECYIDKTADVEGPANWEATLPGELTGVWADDVITVAESQLGYMESKRNYIPGEGRNFGYSRYGAWYGNAYGDWCAMYVSFCLHYAGIPADAFPRDASCPNWVSTLKTEKMYGEAHGKKAYVPTKGDVIFFDWEGDGTSDHVGLVVEVKDDVVKTIEGNSGDVVQYCSYDVDSGEIMGYGKLPVNPDDPNVKAQAEAEKKKADEEKEKAEEEAKTDSKDEAEEALPQATYSAPSLKANENAKNTVTTYARGEADAQHRYEDAQRGGVAPAAAPATPANADDVEGDAQIMTGAQFVGIAASDE